MLEKLILGDDLIVQINAYSHQCLPEEACGLIAGARERSQAFLPVTNELHNPSAFRMDPQEQLNAFLWIESQSLELMAVFHTHPNGPEVPSATDLAEFFYPGVLSVIWTPVSMRAFYILQSGFSEIPVVFLESSI
jgi:proteasome lid subunit RPN8/RPN11